MCKIFQVQTTKIRGSTTKVASVWDQTASTGRQTSDFDCQINWTGGSNDRTTNVGRQTSGLITRLGEGHCVFL